MALVLSSATSSQAELDHAASEDWRTPPVVPDVDLAASEQPETEDAEGNRRCLGDSERG